MADLSALTQYAVVAFVSLFILVDPLATAPLFLVMTEGDPPDKRRQMARRAAWMACLTLTGFALLGDVLLRLFSLTLSAFRIAGGIILSALPSTCCGSAVCGKSRRPKKCRKASRRTILP